LNSVHHHHKDNLTPADTLIVTFNHLSFKRLLHPLLIIIKPRHRA
jgi:hypothetical protein